MRKLLLPAFMLALSAIAAIAAEPTMKYQMLVKDAMGNAMGNADVTLSIKIHEGSADGEVVFNEVHNLTTTQSGIIYANIGEKSGVSLAELNWASNDMFMETEITRGGETLNLGTQQMMAVPRTCYAHSAGRLTLTSPSGQKWDVTIANDGTLSTKKAQ